MTLIRGAPVADCAADVAEQHHPLPNGPDRNSAPRRKSRSLQPEPLQPDLRRVRPFAPCLAL
jgi:hypothetical protein